MARLRIVFGILGLVFLALAFNILAFRREVFLGSVLAPFGIGFLFTLAFAAISVFVKSSEGGAGRRGANLNGIFASLIFLCICIVCYAFFRKWDRSWDLTQEGRTDLAPQTIQLLQGLTQDVTAYGLFTAERVAQEREIEVAQEKARLFLERCARLTNHLQVEFLDPQKDLGKVKGLGLTYADPRGTIVLKCGSQTRTIPLGGEKSQPRLEERDFTNTLINIIENTQPKIGFVTGHGEVDISRPQLAMLKGLLSHESYKPESMQIRPKEGGISGDYDVLVIDGLNAEMGGDFSDEELSALDTYVQGGGRILVLADPQFSVGPTPTRKRLLEWLQQRFGIVVGEDIVISKSDPKMGEVTLLSDTGAKSVIDELGAVDVDFKGCYEQSSPITRNFDKSIVFAAVRSVTMATELPPKVAGQTILRTLPFAWAETNLAALAQGGKPAPDPSEKIGSIGVASAAVVQTDRPVGDSGQLKTARAVVIGDSDFIQNDAIKLGGNLNFIMNTFAWLTEREQLIAIRPTGKENKPIKLSEADETAVGWIAGMGVVQTVILVALAAYVLRRRYR